MALTKHQQSILDTLAAHADEPEAYHVADEYNNGLLRAGPVPTKGVSLVALKALRPHLKTVKLERRCPGAITTSSIVLVHPDCPLPDHAALQAQEDQRRAAAEKVARRRSRAVDAVIDSWLDELGEQRKAILEPLVGGYGDWSDAATAIEAMGISLDG